MYFKTSLLKLLAGFSPEGQCNESVKQEIITCAECAVVFPVLSLWLETNRAHVSEIYCCCHALNFVKCA